MVELWHGLELLPQNPRLEVPNCILQLVAHMLARADAEYLVELFQGKCL